MATFDDLPADIKFCIVEWAHVLDEIVEARNRTNPQRTWDKKGQRWLGRAKGAGRCNALFEVNKELNGIAASKVFKVGAIVPWSRSRS
jgi:hypothetical protein